jgi:hypothetical protein
VAMAERRRLALPLAPPPPHTYASPPLLMRLAHRSVGCAVGCGDHPGLSHLRRREGTALDCREDPGSPDAAPHGIEWLFAPRPVITQLITNYLGAVGIGSAWMGLMRDNPSTKWAKKRLATTRRDG